MTNNLRFFTINFKTIHSWGCSLHVSTRAIPKLAVCVLLGMVRVQAAWFFNHSNKLNNAEYSLESYTRNMERIVQTLRRQNPTAAIAVLTISPMGEDLSSNNNAQASHTTSGVQSYTEYPFRSRVVFTYGNGFDHSSIHYLCLKF